MKNLFVFAVLFCTAIPAWASHRFSVLQGATSASETFFTVMASRSEGLQFRARPDGKPGLLVPITAMPIAYPGSDRVVHRLHATELAPNVPYVLEILDSNGRLLEQRKFKALDINKPAGRIAVGSCMVRQLHNPGIWYNLSLPENRPDLLVITGDITYLDRANILFAKNPETGLEAWEEFAKSRETVDLYFWDHLVPTLSVWDDHDSGGDNVDSNFPLMREIGRIYDTFMANESIPGFLVRGPGMAKQFRLFGKNFIVLDGRSFRDASPASPLFGEEQVRWMLDQIQPGANILVSGTQFFGGPIQKDSLEYNWPEHNKEFMARLRQEGERKGALMSFVSGDVHFSEVEDIEPDWLGYWTVEVTSSNIHSFGFPGHYILKPMNPRRREVTGTHNIVLMEFPATARFLFDVRSMGWRGNNLFSTTVEIKASAMHAALPAKSCERMLAP